MYPQRPPEQQIDRYTGPYERWIFSPELGRPFAFPAISEGNSGFFTALMEGSEELPSHPDLVTRKPPLWNPLSRTRAVTPFAFHDASGAITRSDTDLARLLSVAGPQTAATDIEPRFRVNFPVSPQAWTPTYRTAKSMKDWAAPGTAPKAIIAVIDDGIPFAHRAFLDAQGRSRMSHVWLQSGRARSEAAVPFGRELMNTEIDALRANCGDDEDLIYRTAGAIDSSLPELGLNIRRQATHGAHIAGMCAGNDTRLSSHPLGDDIQIIAVQLPNTIAWDTSGFGKEMYMLSALHYVFDRARAIAAQYATDPGTPEELPLIVNFSYGWSASRHDGQSEMELAIQELLSERQTLQPASAIVMPTGNNFDTDMHGQITANDMAKGAYTFGWKLPPDDHTSSYLEIWLPEGMNPADYTVSVRPPAGHTLSAGGSIPISADASLAGGGGDPRRFSELETGNETIGQLSADKHRGSCWRVLLAMIPTVFTRGCSRRTPAGLWKITLHRNGGAVLEEDQQINIWVQRDDDPAALNTRGRQSKLVDLACNAQNPEAPWRQYSDTLGFIRGYGCTNGVASSPAVTRVAGYVASTARPSQYSGSSGVTRDTCGTSRFWGAPTTLIAVADESRMLSGTLSIGVRSGSGTRLAGTSGAAPAASRCMVINAAAGRPLFSRMEGPLPFPTREREGATPTMLLKHQARAGHNTVQPVGKSRTRPSAP